ncbi:MAG TPA: hypothetical protein ENO16_06950 [Chromatiales bacterium]|nr:hypothetical protein [Chromatiales bacterium]
MNPYRNFTLRSHYNQAGSIAWERDPDHRTRCRAIVYSRLERRHDPRIVARHRSAIDLILSKCEVRARIHRAGLKLRAQGVY